MGDYRRRNQEEVPKRNNILQSQAYHLTAAMDREWTPVMSRQTLYESLFDRDSMFWLLLASILINLGLQQEQSSECKEIGNRKRERGHNMDG